MSPATVDTSTTYQAIIYGYMRKGFYAVGRFWAFYSNGTNAVYESTTDPAVWAGDVTSIGACVVGLYFSIWFDGTYVHYARSDAYGDWNLYYRRGTPVNDGTITWSAIEQTVHSGEEIDHYECPCISVDSGGYAWIGALYVGFIDTFPYVLKNANLDGTWAEHFATQLNVSSDLWRVCPVPLTSAKVYVIYCQPHEVPLGKLYDAGWGGEENDLADHAIQENYAFSAVALVDNVHFVYNRDITNQLRHNERVWNVGWDAADVLVQDNVTYTCGPALSVDPSEGDLYCFWALLTPDHVYYKQYTDGAWGDLVDWIDETVDAIPDDYLVSSFYEDYGGYIGLLYITDMDPSNVRFAYLTTITMDPPTVTTQDATGIGKGVPP